MANKGTYDWKFKSVGGTARVSIATGEDIAHLAELDQKLWTVISCPTSGLEFDPATLAMMDADNDGKIRVGEVVATAGWLTKVLKTPDSLIDAGAELPLSAINVDDEEGKKLYDSAKQILSNLSLEKDSISVADSSDSIAIFAKTKFNGDGIVTADSTDDEDLKAVMAQIIACQGAVADRSGVDGVDAAKVEAFYAACADYAAWMEAGEAEGVHPYGPDTPAAFAAVTAVKDKVADYFMRCKLAAFASDSTAALDVSAEKIGAISDKDLSACSDEISSYPIAKVSSDGVLPFKGINPAWMDAFAQVKALVLDAKFASADGITEADWNGVLAGFDAFVAWNGAKKGAEVEALGLDAVKAVLSAARKDDLLALIAEDAALESEANAIASVDRLTHLHRDFHTFLKNYITLDDLYAKDTKAIFQAGTLYIDQRSCDLCVKVADMGKQGEVQTFGGMYLLYCSCTSKTKGVTMNIAAAMTDGDVNNLRVGMNAVFYDRDGVDYDAVVTKIVDNPISVRQAFWSPYRKLGNFISEKITKNVADKESKATSGLIAKADGVSVPAAGDKPAEAAKPAPFDIAKFAGIFAAIGMALGMIGSAVMKIIDPWYNILILFVVLIICISGPSMFLAWQKLRKRNLAPVLNANGWAVNANVRIDIPFGNTLTQMPDIPAVETVDPAARAKKRARNAKRFFWCLLVLLILGGAGYAYYLSHRSAKAEAPAPVEQVVEAPAAEAVPEAE